jgi:uncharacterized protein YdaT
MPFSENDFPASMQSLTVEVRNKAIEIANALLEQDYEEQRAVAIATAQAKEWAENRDIPVKDDPDAGPDLHVVPHDEGWAIREAGSDDVKATFDTKDDAVQQGREMARDARTFLIIHRTDGTIQDRVSYSGAE